LGGDREVGVGGAAQVADAIGVEMVGNGEDHDEARRPKKAGRIDTTNRLFEQIYPPLWRSGNTFRSNEVSALIYQARG
jgi:hypothetical protein